MHVASFTSPSLAAMCEVVAVPIPAVGRGSPNAFGYRVPRVTEFSNGPGDCQNGRFE